VLPSPRKRPTHRAEQQQPTALPTRPGPRTRAGSPRPEAHASCQRSGLCCKRRGFAAGKLKHPRHDPPKRPPRRPPRPADRISQNFPEFQKLSRKPRISQNIPDPPRPPDHPTTRRKTKRRATPAFNEKKQIAEAFPPRYMQVTCKKAVVKWCAAPPKNNFSEGKNSFPAPLDNCFFTS